MRIKIPIQIIELETDNFHIMVSSVTESGTMLNWVIDTGASKTVFDRNLKEYYSELEGESDELHSAGINEEPMKVSMGNLKEQTLGNLSLTDLKVALIDLSHINDLYSKSTDKKICGLLGGDFLMKHKAVIDYRKSRLVLRLF